uniref:PASTA domain-containing protein n=1 Tax=Nakamurella sp. TaxID=1869182 RepID=UPI003B3BD90F
GTVTPTESSDADKDKVVNQRPSSQTQVAQDSAVNLEIGKGVSLIAVPNVVSYTPEEAKKALNAANLQYEEVPQPSSDADKGKALSQDPAAQTPVQPGSTVKVTVGTGLQIVQVPDGLVGKSLDEATQILTDAKLQVVSQRADSAEPENEVTAVDPAVGTRVQEGTPITLTVSNGNLMVMPNLVNSTPDEAVAALKARGWAGDSVRQTTQEVSNPGLVGAIISQNPASGTTVPKTTAVRVVVGVAAPPPTTSQPSSPASSAPSSSAPPASEPASPAPPAAPPAGG